MNRNRTFALAGLIVGLSLLGSFAIAQTTQPATPEKAQKLMSQGNWKEAYEAFAELATSKDADPKQVGGYLNNGVACLQQLGRVNEIDAFRERVIAAHKGNWRLLWSAAQSYMNVMHYGVMVAGQFERGPHRGGGHYVNAFERDRVRALQLMDQARQLVPAEQNKHEVGSFWFGLSELLLANRGYSQAWRLQYLTDLNELPDYDEGYYGVYEHWYGGSQGAPVDENGEPVYHHLPKSWETAVTDGQRWRWCLLQAAEYAPTLAGQATWTFADFLHNQFGVQTMASYGWYFGRQAEAGAKTGDTGTFELHTLSDNETIARLATGVKRFTLPDEFNFVRIFAQLANDKAYGHQPREMLAQIYENRRQYPKAAEQWRKAIAEFGPGQNNYRQQRLQQIVGNWGMFEPVMSQPAGEGATVEFRFRNGNKVHFTAHQIDVDTLLADVKEYLKSNPKQLDWQKLQIENLGYRLVEQNQQKYVGEKVADWQLDLEPRPDHFDKRITVATPLKKAGAYLLAGRMENGNVSRIVIWVSDLVIVRKPLNNRMYHFVADAVTGEPVAKANVEFFGYNSRWEGQPNRGGKYIVETKNFAEFTDADGQVITTPEQQPQGYSWLITARTENPARIAYFGFTGVWYPGYHDYEYNQVKVFTITDRPVYRPGQPVKFKFWVNRAQYDKEGDSQFAGQSFTVQVNNPKGEKIFEKGYKADQYGGFDGELTLEAGATLGVYQLYVVNHGGGNFRVEEYKKPEFEVTVDSPSEPVMLGEKFGAKINARYYFGSPVVNAKVKYKVLRSTHDATWYPVAYWDWYYGRGYWWFAYDYVWYPGWQKWGCPRPMPWWWWNWHPRTPPEVVAEGEAPIGADGTFKIEIDTALAKAVHSDSDHKYEITAEVTDQSRRTIVGQGTVLVAREPFKVYAWVNSGYFRAGDVVHAQFNAQTIDNKPVQGKGTLKLLRITYDKKSPDNLQPVEKVVQQWDLPTGPEGRAEQQIRAAEPGQYRLSYTVTDAKGHTIEGGYVFVIRGEGFDGGDFRFNEVELVPGQKEYKPGEKVELMCNVNREGGTLLLFVRPANGVYLEPKVIRLKGKSVVEAIEVTKKDMPNFFVEGLTVHNAKVFTEAREIVVPPESRVLDVAVSPSGAEFKPGEKAKFKIKLTDPTGEPYAGSTVVAIYDKAVEYISGGSNVPEIKEFFWKWRRHHQPRTEDSFKGGSNVNKSGEPGMGFLGVFGYSQVDELDAVDSRGGAKNKAERGAEYARKSGSGGAPGGYAAAPMAAGRMLSIEVDSLGAARNGTLALADRAEGSDKQQQGQAGGGGGGAGAAPTVEPTVRKQFADTALWVAALSTNAKGEAEVELDMPENLTTWTTRVWAMGQGTKVGQGSAEVVTRKNLIIRLQAPRFFVQKDEVVLSANVHNYLKGKKSARVVLELEGGTLEPMAADQLTRTVEIDANGEARVDWRVKVVQPGNAVVRMKALTDEESDAMQMEFPVLVHGMLKTESFSGVIRPDGKAGKIAFTVPAERRPEQSELIIRYSPTLAGAMVDALPYMVDYPYGCTEQTLNRFLPTVITQRMLVQMGLDLDEIRKKQANLNAQEIGDAGQRAKDWSYRGGYMSRATAHVQNPVWDRGKVKDMVQAGLERLGSMQCSDGGWGWFSGWGEQSYPHTTAVVVHGLQIAQENDVALVPGLLDRGVAWLKNYQDRQVQLLENAKVEKHPMKRHADNIDALVYMVLVDAKVDNKKMREFLYRDRNELAVYAKAMFGLACHKLGDVEKRDMLLRNIEQFLVNDDENQTAYLKLPNGGYWWYWYGSETEAHAFYLKLLSAVEPKGEKASRIVKYLINNRKHASYWNSTRDTAYVVEAFADYIKASGEFKPDLTLTVKLDGKVLKTVKIDQSNLFSFDDRVVLLGEAVTSGKHTIELAKTGDGPVYYNAYLTNFTLEDPITKAGLEIKVERRYFKLVEVDKKVHVAGDRGQALRQKVEKYERQPLENLDMLTSGDLVEVELVIESKNDYEYIMFEDAKPAGFEPVEVRSGYTGNEMGAYVEFRDQQVSFFVRMLARGRHSVSYRMRAEIPGKFSALPTKASAMYAPELKANSDELKLQIKD